MLGGADNPNGELPSYIIGANTEEGIHSACRELRPTDDEITALLETVGNSDMKVYRREGVTDASVCDLLTRHREAVNRQVMVPAQVLSRLVHDAERELVHQEGLAWDAGGPTPARISQGMADVEVLKALLAA
ncbi:DUF1380 family protein [Enterobacter mori]|uniref:DUF1380 family protein n=1 Tax=Enterobacter mori TaxID=539813 RepID=UPI002A8071F8|nr:DUF1380 family protein [Enterobacter mori]